MLELEACSAHAARDAAASPASRGAAAPATPTTTSAGKRRARADPPGSAPAPSAAVAATRHVDVGEQQRLEYDPSHAAAGMRLRMPNGLWEPGARGSTPVEILGAALDDAAASFAIRDVDADVPYRLARAQLMALAPKKLQRLL